MHGKIHNDANSEIQNHCTAMKNPLAIDSIIENCDPVENMAHKLTEVL